MISGALSGDMANKLGSAIGANPQMAQAAMTSAVPAILGAMMQKGSSSEGAGQLIDLLSRGNHDQSLGNLASVLGGGDATASLLRTGAGLLPALFGNRGDAISKMIASLSGLSPSSSSSLMTLLAPLAMGFITKQLRGSGGLNLGSLMNLFTSQSSFLKAAAPAGLASALGLNNLDDIASGLKKVAGAVPAVPAVADTGDSGWLKWVIGLAVLGLLFFLLRGCFQQTAKVEPPAAPPAVVQQPIPPPSDGLIDLRLSDGSVIRVAANGVESQLVGFIQDQNKAVDETTWFTFDRLAFETGSATLQSSSGAQLDNIAAILRAFPNVNLKIGGYTDNTGDAAANLKLSADRATSTVTDLTNRGVAAGRLASEGYGDQFPVADNATEEGRQKNRRIDVRVTQK
jgi:outer membrane protein OmpA-like peptidoglycan-associated protein